jgi:TPR repeat protein
LKGYLHISAVTFEPCSIEDHGFEGWVSLPSEVKWLGNHIFDSCHKLQTTEFACDILLPELSAFAFSWCRNLTRIVIPRAVRILSESCFSQCCQLREINRNAQTSSGKCLRDGDGIERDLVQAARYFKLSADQGDSNGQSRYGACLHEGNGIAQDRVEAARYFKLSADQGNRSGQYWYGLCLRDGDGVGTNPEG